MTRPVSWRRILDRFVDELDPLRFAAPVTHVYNPLVYARRPHERYLTRYGRGEREVVFLGMNPGPWGMAQTGVPFGEVGHVRDWLGIEAAVGHPEDEHPARPIHGFACPRREVSGARVWGWAKRTFGTPERFFERYFIANYCPLIFLEESGRNRTPDRLKAAEKEKLFAICDRALRDTVRRLRPRLVVGVGRFAEGRARAALGDFDVEVDVVAHPSPANPAANRGWEPIMDEKLAELEARLG